MKKRLSLLFLALPFALAGCVRNNGLCYCKDSVDADGDGICDNCGSPMEGALVHEHVDSTGDGICDICGYELPLPPDVPTQPCKDGAHVDNNFDGICDVCGANTSAPAHEHIDANPHDEKCDICGAKMETCINHIDQNNDGKCDNCGAIIPKPTGDVTTYLVLSSVGLYKGTVGTTVTDKFLDNTVVFIAKPGTALPGKEDVTHLYGNADFDHWYAYEGAGAPTVYTTVPSTNGKILYASWIENGKDPVNPVHTCVDNNNDGLCDICGAQIGSPIPSETETYYLKTSFSTGNWSEANAKIQMYCWDNSGNSRVYTMNRDSDTQYSVAIPKGIYAGCLFVRMDPNKNFTGTNWSDIWNQSEDLLFGTSHTAQITGWNDGIKGNCGIVWVD